MTYLARIGDHWPPGGHLLHCSQGLGCHQAHPSWHSSHRGVREHRLPKHSCVPVLHRGLVLGEPGS